MSVSSAEGASKSWRSHIDEVVAEVHDYLDAKGHDSCYLKSHYIADHIGIDGYDGRMVGRVLNKIADGECACSLTVSRWKDTKHNPMTWYVERDSSHD